MATAIRMPDLGANAQEIKLVEWLKQEGDPVRRGDPLCEVETDKATDQLESVAEGVLLRKLVPTGSEVQCGMVIAYVGQPGESVPKPASVERREPRAESGGESIPEPPSPPARVENRRTLPSGTAPKVSLVIRNLAQREGIDLDRVVGTGAHGQITREDVLRAKTSASGAVDQAAPLTKEQRAVARQVSRSNREIPTIDLTATVEMSAVIRAREEKGDGPHLPERPEGCFAQMGTVPFFPQESPKQHSAKFAYDSFFLFAAARAIKRFPAFAAHGGDDRVYPHQTIDVCLAVSRDTRLYLPIVRNADVLSLAETDAEVRRLVDNTRSGQLRPEDLVGGCFTVSNLGMYGIDSFQMIIPPEQSGALAIGAVQHRVISQDGKIVLRPAATVVLSVDHRMINGALAAEFLKHLKETLETL